MKPHSWVLVDLYFFTLIILFTYCIDACIQTCLKFAISNYADVWQFTYSQLSRYYICDNLVNLFSTTIPSHRDQHVWHPSDLHCQSHLTKQSSWQPGTMIQSSTPYDIPTAMSLLVHIILVHAVHLPIAHTSVPRTPIHPYTYAQLHTLVMSCIHSCARIHKHTFTHICTCTHVHSPYRYITHTTHTHTHHTHTHTCTHTHTHTCMHVHTHMHVHICMYTHACMCARTHARTRIHTYTHTYAMHDPSTCIQ
jgi:hypothetical protein